MKITNYLISVCALTMMLTGCSTGQKTAADDQTTITTETAAVTERKPVSAGLHEPVVEVDTGKLLGYDNRGTYTFLGIPYAKAERFMMPEPVEPWEGIRFANKHGEVAPRPPISSVPSSDFIIPHR